MKSVMKNIIGKSWRDAASLIVLTKRNSKLLSVVKDRDSVNYDILLQTRARSASFPNSVVFPGGVSETVDGEQHWLDYLRSFGYTEQDFASLHHPSGVVTPIFKDNPVQRHIQLRITAIRETFEELGVLICSKNQRKDRNGIWADVILEFDVKYWQNRISKEPGDLFTLCEELNCYPDIWSLHYWSNWLTPAPLPKRFDTAFFVTALKDKPDITSVSDSEVVGIEWSSPLEIISSNKVLYPPQLYEFYRLSHIKDIEQLIGFASERSGHDTQLIYPFVYKVKDGMLHILPGDDLYPKSSIDYNDNTKKYIDKTILELREGCTTLHRFESKKETKHFVLQNYKPQHHVNMKDGTFVANNTVN